MAEGGPRNWGDYMVEREISCDVRKDYLDASVSLTEFVELEEKDVIELLQKGGIQKEKIFEAVRKWGEEKLRKEKLEVNGANKLKALRYILPIIPLAGKDWGYLRWFQDLTTGEMDLPEPPRARLEFELFKEIGFAKPFLFRNLDAIFFALSENVILHEVFVYGSCIGQALYNLKLRVQKEGEEVYLKVYDLKTDGFTKTYSLKIIPPVLITRDAYYLLVIEGVSGDSYHGENAVENITNDGVTITFCHTVRMYDGITPQGGFHSLVFEKVSELVTDYSETSL